jgi:hypothetical protein
MRNEKEFSTFVLQNLQNLYSKTDLSINENVNILTDFTCVHENGRFQFIHGFAQTDIAITYELTFEPKSQINELFKFYGDKAVKSGKILVPFVILELKCGDVTTDGIRSRDFVASRVKEIFPFCAYYFLAENTKKEEKTLLRQGKSFTNYFISKTEFNTNDIHKIYNYHILPHINNIKTQFNIS